MRCALSKLTDYEEHGPITTVLKHNTKSLDALKGIVDVFAPGFAPIINGLDASVKNVQKGGNGIDAFADSSLTSAGGNAIGSALGGGIGGNLAGGAIASAAAVPIEHALGAVPKTGAPEAAPLTKSASPFSGGGTGGGAPGGLSISGSTAPKIFPWVQ